MNLADLSKEFPRDAIHWRAQTLTRNGDKALALAYLDARDVMDRLDEVCGPNNWQTRYTETQRGRVLCEIGIRINDEWVWKSDGAGDTAVEGEKGGISDALKRAAVQWGIGRYLYRLESVWAPCETYQDKSGKPRFSKWKGSPWDSVRTKPGKTPVPPQILEAISGAETLESLQTVWKANRDWQLHPDFVKAKDDRKLELMADDPDASEMLRAG